MYHFDVGSTIEVCNPWAQWYMAEVVGMRDVVEDVAEPAAQRPRRSTAATAPKTEIKIHYTSFSHRLDEWLDVASARLRAVTVDLSHPVVQAWGDGTAGLIEEDVYEVEELIGKRKRDGKVEYRVKWANWDLPGDSTWEASDKISDDLISDYKEKPPAVARPLAAPATAGKRPFDV